MTRVHTMYTYLINRLTKDSGDGEAVWDLLLDLKGNIEKLNEMTKKHLKSIVIGILASFIHGITV